MGYASSFTLGITPDMRQPQERRHQAWCDVSQLSQALQQGTVALCSVRWPVWGRCCYRIADLQSLCSCCPSCRRAYRIVLWYGIC